MTNKKQIGYDVIEMENLLLQLKPLIYNVEQAKTGGGTRKFFVEAKKPAVRIAEEAAPAYQLRRYAWSAGLPLSILTNFEEFAVYDCRIKPDQNDRPATARILFFSLLTTTSTTSRRRKSGSSRKIDKNLLLMDHPPIEDSVPGQPHG